MISIATPMIRDGIMINFYFIKLNLFFASQVSKKNIIWKKTWVYVGKIQTDKKIITANTIGKARKPLL